MSTGALQNNIYAELATMMPDTSGGIGIYAHEAFKRYVAWLGPLVTWGYWFGWCVVLSINGILIGDYVRAAWFTTVPFLQPRTVRSSRGQWAFAPEFADTVKDTPKALRYSALFSVVAYGLVLLGLVGAIGKKGIAAHAIAPFDLALRSLVGNGLGTLGVVMVLAALVLSANLAGINSTRSLWQMSHSGMTIGSFRRINKAGVPHTAMMFTWATQIVLISTFGDPYADWRSHTGNCRNVVLCTKTAGCSQWDCDDELTRGAGVLSMGLTGAIGSGKSTVAAMFKERGAVVIDADRIARDAVGPGLPAHAAIVQRFGRKVVTPEGHLDRGALAEAVFGEAAAPRALDDLNGIVHPVVSAELARRLAAEAGRETVVVVDVPLLVPSVRVLVDVVAVVDCPDSVALGRLVRLRGMNEADALRRLAAQNTREERLAQADYVIPNGGDLVELAAAVDGVWERITARGAGG